MQALQSSKLEDRTALEARYKQKLRDMDERLRAVAKQERRFAQVERLQVRSQETCQRLQSDIQAIKQQKASARCLRLLQGDAKTCEGSRGPKTV